MTIILHEGTQTVTENLWKTIVKHLNLSHVTIRDMVSGFTLVPKAARISSEHAP